MSTKQTKRGKGKQKPKVATASQAIAPLEETDISRRLQLTVVISVSLFVVSFTWTVLLMHHANGYNTGSPTITDYLNSVISAFAGISFPTFLISGIWLLVRTGHHKAAKSAGILVIVLGVVALVFMALFTWALSSIANF